MKSKGRLERDVQAGVIAYLELRTDFFFWRANISAGVAPSGRFMKSGGKSGAPDIQGIQWPSGRFIGIELKREVGGTVSDDQERWGKNCTNHGGLYVVARSIKEVEIALGPALACIPKLNRKRVYHRP